MDNHCLMTMTPTKLFLGPSLTSSRSRKILGSCSCMKARMLLQNKFEPIALWEWKFHQMDNHHLDLGPSLPSGKLQLHESKNAPSKRISTNFGAGDNSEHVLSLLLNRK